MTVAVADLPPAQQERIVCSIAASSAYQVPADIMLAIAELEGGRPGLESVNGNSTRDIGYMQFNSSYLSSLSSRYNYDYESFAASDGCYAFFLAAWRLSGHLMQDSGTVWQRAANYHSRTPKFNLIYRRKLIQSSRRWAGWLRNNFPVKQHPTGE